MSDFRAPPLNAVIVVFEGADDLSAPLIRILKKAKEWYFLSGYRSTARGGNSPQQAWLLFDHRGAKEWEFELRSISTEYSAKHLGILFVLQVEIQEARGWAVGSFWEWLARMRSGG